MTVAVERLEDELGEVTQETGIAHLGVAIRDQATGWSWDLDGTRWFHAASTIKLAVLVAVYDAIHDDALPRAARVHVRNAFVSAADGRLFRVQPARDANAVVHGHVGRTMRITDLARHMIVTSSNLATNVLVDLLGVERVSTTLGRIGLEGLEFRRGVEDERAWEQGINNRAQPRALVDLLWRILEGEVVSEEACEEMLDVLRAQQFTSGIPAGLPEGTLVANKTGEISTATHDAGIVWLPEREPYVLAVMTEWKADGEPDARGRREAIARVAGVVNRHLTEAERAG